MLAAASAWRILAAEHARLRVLVDTIAGIIEGGGWQQPGPRLERLRALIREFQEFEAGAHRPKGVVLLGSMRGRSAQADQLLDALDDESRRCEQLLAQALELLARPERGGGLDAPAVASLLRQHRDWMVRHLDLEDTVLRSYTAQLLTPEEWSAVVSSMSSVAQQVKRRRVRAGH